MKRRSLLAGGAALLSGCASVSPWRSAPRRGLWRDSVGAFAVGKFPEFGPADFAFDYRDLRMSKLVTDAEGGARMTSTLGGGELLSPVLSDGVGLMIGDRRLLPVAVRRSAFAVRSADAVLSAELAEPDKPRGAVLLVYGSGPAPKEAFDPWAFWFLSQGLAVVAYDKRGSGQSTGDWRLSGLETLAADAQAVISATRREVKGRLFAWGASQAGWILPQLGAAGVVDGFIMHAGPAMTPAAQIVAQVRAELAAYGFDASEIERAAAYYALDTDVSKGVRLWSDLDGAYKAAAARGAEWLLAPPTAADAPERTMIRLMADFDPAPFWRANRAPVLALYGAKDYVVPAEPNLAALRPMLAPGAPLEARILPDANHLMFESRTGLRDEYPTRSRIAPGYFDGMERWLSARL